MTESGAGQIITFYSYKGGTGRTMAMANVAWIIASNGKRVLTMDWDLESPGLHKFFHPFLDESTVSATPGVIEIINDYASAAVDPGPRSDDWYLECRPRRAACRLPGLGLSRTEASSISCRPAGRTAIIPRPSVSLDWDNFYDRLGGGRFFRAMRDDMKRNYDYVLIDSRTGLSRRGRHLHDRAAGRADRLLHAQRSEHRGRRQRRPPDQRPVPGPEYPGAAGPDAHRGRREREARYRPVPGPDAVRRLPGRDDPGELRRCTGRRSRCRTSRSTRSRRSWRPSATIPVRRPRCCPRSSGSPTR